MTKKVTMFLESGRMSPPVEAEIFEMRRGYYQNGCGETKKNRQMDYELVIKSMANEAGSARFKSITYLLR
jgi:hypothetical protein